MNEPTTNAQWHGRLKQTRAAMTSTPLSNPEEYTLIAMRAVLLLFPHGDIEGRRTEHVIATVREYAFTPEERVKYPEAIEKGFQQARARLRQAYDQRAANEQSVA